MSPLQKIAMGLVLMTVPAGFKVGGYVWDGLPDPLGWLLVISGVLALRASTELDLEWVLGVARTALAVSIVQWIPPLFELFLPADKVGEASIKWAFFLPQAVFLFLLARTIGKTAIEQEPRDSFVAGRYGVLMWAAVAVIVLPPIGYGTGRENVIDTAAIAIGLVDVAFIYQLFRVHRREWLGGAGPLLIHPKPRNDEGRPASE
ncbi:MAG: hypothetical protein ACJ72D_24815 [Marmoricola sp.]